MTTDADLRKQIRHRRRMRNQFFVYLIVAILLCTLGYGIFLGGRQLLRMWNTYQTETKETIEEITAGDDASTDLSVAVTTPENEQEPVTKSDAELLDEIVGTCISEMPLEDKVAGLFMITPEQLTGVDSVIQAGATTQDALTAHAVGGLIYASKNLKAADQIQSMLGDTQTMSKYPLFMAYAEDGNNTSVAEAMGAQAQPSLSDLVTAGDAEAAYQAGAAEAVYLRSAGFNVNLAPMVNAAEGQDPATIAGFASAQIRGMQENGISAAMKYFPVQSNDASAEQDGIETTQRLLDEMRSSEFLPFQSGIEAGTAMIVVTNMAAPNATGDNTPCCLSDVMVTNELRTELGYEGVIVTDALNDPAVTDYYTADQAAVAAIQAGADLICMPEDFETAYQGVLDAVNSGVLTEERINESLQRIYRIKYADKVSEINASVETMDSAESASTEE